MKLTLKTYLHWSANLNNDLNNSLRMGQSFCNCFSINNNELFYSNDIEKVKELIQKIIIEEGIV